MKLPQAFLTAGTQGQQVTSRIDMGDVVLENKCPECKQPMKQCFLEGDQEVNACLACRITLPRQNES